MLLATSLLIIGVPRGLGLLMNDSSFDSFGSLKCALKGSLMWSFWCYYCDIYLFLMPDYQVYNSCPYLTYCQGQCLLLCCVFSCLNFSLLTVELIRRRSSICWFDKCSTTGLCIPWFFVIFGETNCFRCCIGDTCSDIFP